MPNKKIVNQRIEKLRKTLGLTQPEFAKKLGMEEKKGRSAVNNWESGVVQVKSDTLIAISETFGVSSDWLLGLETDANRQMENLYEKLDKYEQIIEQISMLIREYKKGA